MPWRAKCYECEQETGITRPVVEKLLSFLRDDDRENAIAYYEHHGRTQTDVRTCGGSGKPVPKVYM
jgi:hypothetical protein